MSTMDCLQFEPGQVPEFHSILRPHILLLLIYLACTVRVEVFQSSCRPTLILNDQVRTELRSLNPVLDRCMDEQT